MSKFRYSSRGRTRQPKNLYLNNHTGSNAQSSPQAHFKSSGSITIRSGAGDLHERLGSAAAGGNGYDTENQKFLHVCLSQSTATARSVDVYGYNNQFGTWGKLYDKSSQWSPATGSVAGVTFMDAYVPMTLTSVASTCIYLTIPVEGVDRVGFVGASVDGLYIYVAGSTL